MLGAQCHSRLPRLSGWAETADTSEQKQLERIWISGVTESSRMTSATHVQCGEAVERVERLPLGLVAGREAEARARAQHGLSRTAHSEHRPAGTGLVSLALVSLALVTLALVSMVQVSTGW